ncbi:MAG: M1 family aminopeptidase [Sphingorhabdus sp.]
MFAGIALFEFRYQLKNPVFWVAIALFFLLGFGLSASENVSLGTPGSVHENAPHAIASAVSLLSLFYMFIAVAFAANALIRDDAAGFAPIIRTTSVTKSDLLLGRFAGALLIALLGFVAVPLGMGIGVMMPWVDSETVGPGGIMAYAWNYLIFGVPNIFFICALLFGLATITRSMLASYIGVVVLFMAYNIAISVLTSDPAYYALLAKYEPFGFGAIMDATRYWTSSDMNTRLLSLEGNLLFNRILVVVLGLLALAATWWRFSMTERAPSKRKLKKLVKQEAKLATAAAIQPVLGGAAVIPSYGAASTLTQFMQRLRLEILQVLKSPGLIVLLFLALCVSGISLYFSQTLYGAPSYPLTADIIATVAGGAVIFLVIIAVFYGGELVWRERDVKIGEIVDSTPVAGWVVFLPKIIAIFAVLVLVNLAAMSAGLVYQAAKGVESFGIADYFSWFIIPQSIDMMLIAILAVFFQVISPNKYIGWGLYLVWIIVGIFLGNLGYTNMLYLYGAGPGEPLSDMNGLGSFWVGGMWARFYWACFAALLMVVAHLIWPRGTVVALRPRLAGMRQRFGVGPALVGGLALAGMIGSGLFINHNIKVLNTYRTSDETEKLQADYERKYLKYETLQRPVITAIDFDVQLYPRERRMDVSGKYDLRNEGDTPITDVHIRQQDPDTNFANVKLAGAKLASHDKKFGYRIFRFATPLVPGATTQLTFNSKIAKQGFANGGPDTTLVENGTFANNQYFGLMVGMDRQSLLSDRTQRRRQGLPDELRMAKLENTAALQENYGHMDWVTSRIRFTTDADQTPIAPGKRMSDETNNGRRTALFVSEAPILNFFSLQSARYAEETKDHNGIKLSVFYDPKHKWNVPNMMKALETSIDYYRENFGPYQFDHARIIEFPRFSGSFAQAFAGTMPYSESIGFAADVRDAETIDYVSYVTAHELGHQYWAHQVMGGDVQGSTVTTETMAQYSALMVMKKLYGADKIRRFLKFELDRYLSSRKGEVLEELPLYRVENQGYIHYRKGALVMYLLQERLGEDAVNRALARFIRKYKFGRAPYHRSVDLIAEFRKEAKTPAQQALITDLFERITLFDLKTTKAETKKGKDGVWTTTLTIEAKKLYADGKGVEKQARLSDEIEIGLFTERPGRGAFDRENVLSMKRHPIKGGKQVITLRSKKKPVYAGIDPYNFYIDRNSDDNVLDVTEG